MTPKELYEVLMRIERQAAKADGKLSTLCKTMSRLEEGYKNLPCEKHAMDTQEKLSKKVNWGQLWGVIVMVSAVVLSGFAFTNQVNIELKTHETSLTPHYHSVYEHNTDMDTRR